MMPYYDGRAGESIADAVLTCEMCIKLWWSQPPRSSSRHRREEACTLWNGRLSRLSRLSIFYSAASRYSRPSTMDAGSHVNAVSPTSEIKECSEK